MPYVDSETNKRHFYGAEKLMLTVLATVVGGAGGTAIGVIRSNFPEYKDNVAIAAAEKVAAMPDSKDLPVPEILVRIERAKDEIEKERASERAAVSKAGHDGVVGAAGLPAAGWGAVLGAAAAARLRDRKKRQGIETEAELSEKTPGR